MKAWKKVVSLAMAGTMTLGMSCGAVFASTSTVESVTESTAESSSDWYGDVTRFAGKKYKIGYAPATLNNAFWLAVEDGAKEAIKDSGADVELVEVDANADQSQMNDGIANLISDNVDAMLIAPADSTAAVSAIKQCNDAGVPVVNFDTPIEDDSVDLVSIIASDNYNAGYVVGEDLASKMDDGAKILVFHSNRASACVQRLKGFKDALEKSGKKYTIVNELDGYGDTEKTMTACNDALVADPDLSAIFCVNDPSAMGAVQSIHQTSVELKNDIMVYGVDGNPDAKKLIKSGEMEGTGSQSPETLGYDSLIAALMNLNGEEVESNIVVPTFLITADNVDQFGTDGWQ